MTRDRMIWKLRDRELALGDRTLVMAILNVTPDSFSDGGLYDDPQKAAERALELQSQGADIIDIGAESTRPGSERINEGEELRRLIPVLKLLKDKLDIPISVDTYKPGVAEAALRYGVQIINDPSGLTWEPDLAKVVVQSDAGLILNHTRGMPDTWAKLPPIHDVMGTIRSELEASVNRARAAGVLKERLAIDPGFGFGKRPEQNPEILARLDELQKLTLPVLAGPSRKRFLAKATELETEFATAAAVAMCVLGGAHMVRVHDVKAARAAIQIADAVAAEQATEKTLKETREIKRDPGPPKFDDEARRRPIRPTTKRPAQTERPAAMDQPRDRPPREERPDRDQRPPRGEKPEWVQRKMGPPRPPRRDAPRPGEGRPPFREGRPPSREGRPPSGEGRPSSKEGKPPFREGGPPRQDRPPFQGRPSRPSRPGGRPPGPPRKFEGPKKFAGPPRTGGAKRSGGPPRPGGQGRPPARKNGRRGPGSGGGRPPRPPGKPGRGK